MLLDIMSWTEDEEQASVIAGCLRYVQSLGPAGAREVLKARHEIAINENVAQKIYSKGQRLASMLDAEDV
ncbi:hypothetical protein [Pseudomonas fluorescens]|uniref:hypothetical protein n=1 Tax=Pseudomonas fluorescens TaxID=294 RepID=UPI001241C047|nr:hypothetical protein [Pseudomonas fluorescens]